MEKQLYEKVLLTILVIANVNERHGAKADTIRTGKPLEKFQLLKPTTRQYMRYLLSNGKRVPVDIWTRKVTFGNLTANLQLVFTRYGKVQTFTHDRTTGKVFESFVFGDGKVKGTDKPGNTKREFSVDSPVSTFNFETDMETFQMLPLKTGYVAVINFYHPGSPKPDWYTFKVDGSETLTLASGKTMECWILSTDYNSPERGRTRDVRPKDQCTKS